MHRRYNILYSNAVSFGLNNILDLFLVEKKNSTRYRFETVLFMTKEIDSDQNNSPCFVYELLSINQLQKINPTTTDNMTFVLF